MSNHETMRHEAGDPSEERSGDVKGWGGILRSRAVSIGVVLAVLVVGFLLTRRFGIGSWLLVAVGLAVFAVAGRRLLQGGHGSHGSHGTRGHGGCH